MKKEMEQAKNDEEFIKRTYNCQKEFDRSSSIESLNKLYDKYSCDDEFLEDDKLFSIILKDLEVLEILKKNVVCKDGTTTTFDTRDEKVRKWFENE